jgi:hypothetical protein
MIVLGLSYQQRAYSYIALITEDWPPFTDDKPRSIEEPSSFGALPSTPPAAGTAAEAPAAPPATSAPEAPYSPPEAPGEAAPPPPERTDDDEEPPPGPFGPSSTNP